MSALIWFLEATGLDRYFENAIILYESLDGEDIKKFWGTSFNIFGAYLIFGGRFLYVVKCFKFDWEGRRM